MIVRFFNTGTGNGEAPVKYLLSTHSHDGQERSHKPELLEGSPALTIELINGIQRKYKYASGCLAFRSTEQPTRAELLRILDQFKKVVAPGLSPDQFNALFVLHREQPDKATGLEGFHVHFVLPMTLLGGQNSKGKSLAGKRWNPHPPGDQTIEVMSLFTSIVNHENGWKQVHEKPTRLGMDSFWRKAKHYTQKQKSELLHAEVLKAVRSGTVKDRRELMVFMEDALGLTVTRASDKTVSVKFPGTPKAIKLKGALYEHESNYVEIKAKQQRASFGGEEFSEAKKRLEQLLAIRAVHITDTPKTTTRKERVYGKQSTNRRSTAGPEKANARGGIPPLRASEHPHRTHKHTDVPSGLERNVLQTRGGQWSDSHGWNHSKDGQGLGDASDQSQQAVQLRQDSCQNGSGRGGQWRGGRAIASFNPLAEIAEQIRALSIQLNDCEVGSTESRAITDQLNLLQGAKDRLPKGPRIKP
ncbi:hypothetical protein [Limnohabitans sp.]